MPDLPLSTAEIVQMRHTIEAYLAGTAVIHTRADTTDSQGGFTAAYTAASTVDARLAPDLFKRGGESALAGRVAEVQSYILTVPSTTTLAETSRVVYNSVTYEVDEVLNTIETPWNLCIRARLTRID